jgi:hypothetical protein
VGLNSEPPRCIGNSPAMTTLLRAVVATRYPGTGIETGSLRLTPEAASNFWFDLYANPAAVGACLSAGHSLDATSKHRL